MAVPRGFFEALDIPNLRREGTAPVPGGDDYREGLSRKWDISRRKRLKLVNADGTTLIRTDWNGTDSTDKLLDEHKDEFPAAEIVLNEYPEDGLIGNDDVLGAELGHEHSIVNPYSNFDFLPFLEPDPQVGQVASYDAPRSFSLRTDAGETDETAEGEIHFQEFVRVSIGNKWYLISAYKEWRQVYIFEYDGENMRAGDLLFEENNNGW